MGSGISSRPARIEKLTKLARLMAARYASLMRLALVFTVALSLVGCIAPITPMERLQQSANDVAGALRFGRTDLVAEYVATDARDAFLSRHAVWEDKTRVVDLELAGVYLRSMDEAEAVISVSWLRVDGAMLHTTLITQRWKHERGTFRIVDEVFRSGDKLLFEMLPKKEAKPPGDSKEVQAANLETPIAEAAR